MYVRILYLGYLLKFGNFEGVNFCRWDGVTFTDWFSSCKKVDFSPSAIILCKDICISQTAKEAFPPQKFPQ